MDEDTSESASFSEDTESDENIGMRTYNLYYQSLPSAHFLHHPFQLNIVTLQQQPSTHMCVRNIFCTSYTFHIT